MMPDVRTFSAWYTESRKLTQAGSASKTILVTDGNENQPGSLC